MNRTAKILSIFLLVIGMIIGFAYYSITQIDFVGTKNPEYLKHVQTRINFGTTQCENTTQWDTITNRINDFFDKNSAFSVPDSLEIETTEHIGSGWAGFEKAIYFGSKPIEIYIVSFNSSSHNHIDFTYGIQDSELIKKKTDLLNVDEKNRIKQRLNFEILSRIDWDVSDIQATPKGKMHSP